MSDKRDIRGWPTIGYALGVGLASVPLVGMPARFMFADAPALPIYGAALVAGMVIGALFSRVRPPLV